jgi:cytosine/adenosine deaminase-related metal-dependent hydrolase
MALVIAGRVVPMSATDPSAVFSGRVYLGDDGFVEAVTSGTTAAPAGFSNAPVVDVGDALVIPGLIDLHNHLGYNALPLWVEPTQKKPFLHHDDWPNKPSYKPDISWPAWVLANAEPEALLAYVQARALIGGTTSIQGWPAFNRPLEMALRDIDDEKAGTTSRNLVYTSCITQTPEQLTKTAQLMSRGAAFIYHCAEGQPGSIVAREFTDVATAGCMGKKLIAIHCNAVADSDWTHWVEAEAGAVVWSPFSNLWLYGTTTNIPAVKNRDVTICLGSDWGPSGTKHVLGEVKVARLVSEKQNFGLKDQDLVAMMTSNPGDILARCWSRQIGRLVPNSFGDVTILRSQGNGDVWSQIVNATEREVMLVVVGGIPRYGDAAVMTKANSGAASTMTVAGLQRKLAIPDPQKTNQVIAWEDVVSRLDAVRKDPAGALKRADTRARKLTGRALAAQAPLEITLDMPQGSAIEFAAAPADPAKVVIPPLPTLVHDKAFFTSIKGRGFHGGLLDGLAGFYKS